MSSTKAEVMGLLDRLPDDRLLEDAAGDHDEIERVLSRITLAKDYPYPEELDASEADLWEALQEISAPTLKAELLTVLNRLPDDCTLEDILEQLDEREHLRRGVASAIYEPLVSQDEVEAWVEQWARG